MVQLRVDLASSTDQDTSVSNEQYKPSIEQKYKKGVDDSNSLSISAKHLSVLAWRAMLDRSTKRLEKSSFFNSVRNS